MSLGQTLRKGSLGQASACSLKGVQNPATVVIEPGGIVKIRYRGRRAGVRITKAAAGEFVGRSFLVKPRRENSGILPKTILSPSGKKIFSAATLPQKS